MNSNLLSAKLVSAAVCAHNHGTVDSESQHRIPRHPYRTAPNLSTFDCADNRTHDAVIPPGFNTRVGVHPVAPAIY